MADNNDNRKLNRRAAAQQNADVRISDRGGYAYGELGRSGRSVGIVPFGTSEFRQKNLNLAPRGTFFFNLDTNALEVSDPDDTSGSAVSGWVAISGGGSSTPGSGSNVLAGAESETLRWNGTEYEPSSAMLNDGTDIFVGNDLTVSGNLTVEGTTTYTDPIIIASGTAPASTGDATGSVGEIRWSDDYIYIKTFTGWHRLTSAIF